MLYRKKRVVNEDGGAPNYLKKRSGNELLMDLKSQEISGQYKNFTRMSSSTFEILLTKIGPKIAKMDTNMRESISVQDR